MNHYIHSVPGRLRIKIPSIKYQPGDLQSINNLIEGLQGVNDIKANEVTGSIVVNYDPETTVPEQILTILKENDFIGELERPKRNHLQDGLSKSVEAMGKALFGWAVGKALENTGLSFLAVFV